MKLTFKSSLNCIILLVSFCFSYSQGAVGIGTNNPDPSAILDVKSTNKGMLIPRVNRAPGATVVSSPVKGLIVFNENANFNAFEYYDGSDWVQLIPTPAKFNLDMRFNKITNLANGTLSRDAVNKGQLDSEIQTLENDLQTEIAARVALENLEVTGSYDLAMRVVEIGEWNMDLDSRKNVSFGVFNSTSSANFASSRIVSLSIMIQTDNSGVNTQFLYPFTHAGRSGGGGPLPATDVTSIGQPQITYEIRASTVNIYRLSGGFYDNANFDSTAKSRGWIMIIYTK